MAVEAEGEDVVEALFVFSHENETLREQVTAMQASMDQMRVTITQVVIVCL